LLGTGSKPLQLFGLRKTPELSLALVQALSPLGRTGSVPAITKRESRQLLELYFGIADERLRRKLMEVAQLLKTTDTE
jgi:CHASE1-domain containing sensor protein